MGGGYLTPGLRTGRTWCDGGSQMVRDNHGDGLRLGLTGTDIIMSMVGGECGHGGGDLSQMQDLIDKVDELIHALRR